MGLDQKGPVTFHVRQGHDAGWQVIEEGFEKPLAFFAQKEDAKKYANEIVNTKKKGSRVIIDE